MMAPCSTCSCRILYKGGGCAAGSFWHRLAARFPDPEMKKTRNAEKRLVDTIYQLVVEHKQALKERGIIGPPLLPTCLLACRSACYASRCCRLGIAALVHGADWIHADCTQVQTYLPCCISTHHPERLCVHDSSHPQPSQQKPSFACHAASCKCMH